MFKRILVICLMFIFILPVLSKAEIINRVLAEVNDDVITQDDLNKFFLPLKIQLEAQYEGDNLNERLSQAKEDLLKKMIEDKLLLQEAEEIGLAVSDEEVAQRLDYIKRDFSSEEDFIEKLEKSNMDIEDLKQRYKEQILIDKLINVKVKSKVKVTPKEVTEYYNEHKEDFKKKPEVEVRQIFIPKEDEEALEKIKMIKSLLNGENQFKDVASKFSQGPNADEGGLIGLVSKGALIPEIDGVVFNLDAGEISDIVTTSLGYHIFKVDRKLSSSDSDPMEVRGKVRNIIFKNKAHLAFQEYLDNLRKKSYVSIK